MVQAAGIAQIVSRVVPAPQRGRNRAAIHTLATLSEKIGIEKCFTWIDRYGVRIHIQIGNRFQIHCFLICQGNFNLIVVVGKEMCVDRVCVYWCVTNIIKF